MDIRNLTLDQVYDLEATGSLSVGSRSAVFLGPKERATRRTPVRPFAAAADQGRGKIARFQAEVDRGGHIYAPIGKVKSAAFSVGDTVRVQTKVMEGDKERTQVFSGVVIGKRGHGLNETFTVSRMSYGKRVQRVFPVHSLRVDKIEIDQRRDVRRPQLTYLRKRMGKSAHPKPAPQAHRAVTKSAW